MKRFLLLLMAIIALMLAVMGHKTISAQGKQDRYTLKVPGGLAFSDFRGYEDWQVVGPSQTDAQNVMRVILANPVMIKAYRARYSGQRQALPRRLQDCQDRMETEKDYRRPFFRDHAGHSAGHLTEVEFIEKDAKRFADSTDGDTPCSIMTLHPIRSRRHVGGQTAAGERRQVRRRMP